MSLLWQIEYFQENNSTRSPIYSFIEKQLPQNQAKMARVLDLLALYGLQLGMPHVKKLTGLKLWELRIQGSEAIRIIITTSTHRKVVLLHAFIKKTNKVPKRELKLAFQRLKQLTSSK